MDKRVHCHICSMKALCPSTIRHTQTSWRIEKARKQHKQPDFKDLEAMAETTRLCPLLSLLSVAFPDFKVVYDELLEKEDSVELLDRYRYERFDKIGRT